MLSPHIILHLNIGPKGDVTREVQKQTYWLLLHKHHDLFHVKTYLEEQRPKIWNPTFLKQFPPF